MEMAPNFSKQEGEIYAKADELELYSNTPPLNSMFVRFGTDYEIRRDHRSVVFHDFGGNDYRLRPFTVEV